MGTTLKTNTMKFETEFNIGDEIILIHNDVFEKGIITKIKFPEPSIVYNNFDDNNIIYYIWPSSFGRLPESLDLACKNAITKRPYEIGSNLDNLLEKIKNTYEEH